MGRQDGTREGEIDAEQRDYAILVSLLMREEAEVMASALRAEGIDAFVGNHNHANVDWGWTIALGGMQVFVPRTKVQEAKDVIRARIREAAETPDPEAEPTRRHDRWKVWAVMVAAFFLPIGGLTAHTLDEHLIRQSFQIEMPEFFRAFEQELARLGCGPDDVTVLEEDGEARCVELQPYPPGKGLVSPIVRDRPDALPD